MFIELQTFLSFVLTIFIAGNFAYQVARKNSKPILMIIAGIELFVFVTFLRTFWN